MRNLFRRSLRHSRHQILSRRAWRYRAVFWAGAIAVGGTSYLFVAGGQWLDTAFQRGVTTWPLLPFVITPAGLALTAWLTHRLFAGAEGGGVPQVIAAIRLHEHPLRRQLLSLKVAIGKFALTWMALLSGASAGVFAPSIHIGAALIYSAGDRAGIRTHEMQRGLILAGGAAGIAAAFNTPIAGIVFAIEALSRSLEERRSGLMLTAVILAGFTALVLVGDRHPFPEVPGDAPAPAEWLAIVIVGTLAGLFGALFALLAIGLARLSAPIAHRRPVPTALVCGLIVALAGWFSGGLAHGTGFLQAAGAAQGELANGLAFAITKLVATLATLVSGVPAGLFGPALGMGAGLGAAMADWFPQVAAGVIVLLGMTAFFSGMAQTPITAFIVVMEMSETHRLVLPLMATAFIAYLVSRAICHRAPYRALADLYLRPAAAPRQPNP